MSRKEREAVRFFITVVFGFVIVLSLVMAWECYGSDQKITYQTKFDTALKAVQDAQANLDKANVVLNDLLKEIDKAGLTLNPSAYKIVDKPPAPPVSQQPTPEKK